VIRIIAAVEEYLPRILEIERGSIAPPWTHGALLREIYNEDSFFAVATGEDENQIIGFIILRRISDEGELLQIAVDPAARRRGAADALMSAAAGYSKENALRSVFLEVRRSNEAATALYSKHGFADVRVRKDYYSSPVEDAVVMVWRQGSSSTPFSK